MRCSSATHRRIHGHDDAKSSKIRTPMSLALKPFTMSLMRDTNKSPAVLETVLLSNSEVKSRGSGQTNAIKKQGKELTGTLENKQR